jgi:hypothetical protein
MMAQDAGFRIANSWIAGFRGGITGIKYDLPSDHPRWIDTANSLDMHNNLQILKNGEI